MTVALEELRTLRDTGRLAAGYPRVAALLAELTDTADRPDAETADELRRCGGLLARLRPQDVLAHHPDTPVATVAVTGHSGTAQLTDPLVAELARHGLLPRLVTGDHGAYLRDLTDPDSPLRRCGPQLTLCVLGADAVHDELRAPWTVADAEQAWHRLLDRLHAVAAAHHADGTGALVLTTLPLPRRLTHQIVDQQQRALLGAVWRECNARLLRLTAEHPALTVVDLDPLVGESGPATDPRLALYARSALSPAILSALAREAVHVLRARQGLTKKCLVLDLDNTLWDGVLGDDGPDGIACGATLRGEPYAALQRVAKQLAAQGVLLAVSSKNDPGPVAGVLRDHPDMTLRADDFVSVQAGWQPKDAALRDIAGRLGIAADALVFADDTAAERALVRHRVPGAAVVPLGREPARHVDRLLADGWFDTPTVTDDDRHRVRHYRAAADRSRLREAGGSYEQYLRELGIELDISPPRRHELHRMSQLSLRTNQFNLTGERVPPERMAALCADPRQLPLAVRVRDRYGDSGLVGAVLARRDGAALHIDNFFLSCRVLARGVEHGCVSALLAHARDRGLSAVGARHRATRSNGRTRGFYPSLGFVPRATDTGEETHYRHDLAEIPGPPGHLSVRADFEGDTDAC
ncbi:HAD-IIIC family phosphatase [Streptomyces fuscichromogenes]|uniref:HAD-superfamily phosphatase, subfamily IIIC:FkbH n=1 Tax=Streptomyces fuscichromogenes TaxID=1324013 RepID=A0A918CXZ1_9ACTN|nr:HAD-IIIC family phosphatase [Streptomyces fuscichromogenes]GGN45956.1 HAD-superfamily phosphatase, subfamily IIIC:FkbH [Streptomyces fuscichromogenes]